MTVEEAVVGAIRRGNTRFGDIHSDVIVKLGIDTSFRQIDRALQSAKKSGLIKHVKGGAGWTVLSEGK